MNKIHSLRQIGILSLVAVAAAAVFSLVLPAQAVETVTICWNGKTMVVAKGQEVRYPGATIGACPNSPAL